MTVQFLRDLPKPKLKEVYDLQYGSNSIHNIVCRFTHMKTEKTSVAVKIISVGLCIFGTVLFVFLCICVIRCSVPLLRILFMTGGLTFEICFWTAGLWLFCISDNFKD